MSMFSSALIVKDILSIISAIITTNKKNQKQEIFKDCGFWNNKEFLDESNISKNYLEFIIQENSFNQKQTGYIINDSNLNLLRLDRLNFYPRKIFPGLKLIKSLNNQGNIHHNEIIAISLSFKNLLFLFNLNSEKLYLNRIEKFRYQGKHRPFVF